MTQESKKEEEFSKMPTPLPKEEIQRIMNDSKERQMKARAFEKGYMKILQDSKKNYSVYIARL